VGAVSQFLFAICFGRPSAWSTWNAQQNSHPYALDDQLEMRASPD
jgi:hypothetical protein